uniref:Uncharacterized protein n=1 Tax=Rhizophagus irregularis (strain DAOM 181602 / DAOM 197198 / MUCL 43194) TaxID=747089 RepID=U9UCU2_RHIID
MDLIRLGLFKKQNQAINGKPSILVCFGTPVINLQVRNRSARSNVDKKRSRTLVQKAPNASHISSLNKLLKGIFSKYLKK